MFPIQNRKSEHHHWILHIWINLGTKIHPKQTILISRNKFVQKRCSKEMNAIIKFYIFELVWITNFSLNWQFWFFGPNLPKFVNGKIALVHESMLCTGADRHNSILMSLLLIVSETKSRTCLFTNLSSISRFSK